MRTWFHKLNLFQRLLIYFTVIIIFSIVVVSVTTYLKSSKAIENQVSIYLKQIVSNVNLQIDDYLGNYELATLPLVTNEEVKTFVEGRLVDNYGKYMNYMEIKSQMNETIIERPEIEQIYLMEGNGHYIVSRDTSSLTPIDEFYQELNELTSDSGTIFIYPRISNDELVITMARKIRGMTTWEPKGILAVDLNASRLIRSWGEINLEDNSFFMIVDDKGKIIYHPEIDYIGQEMIQPIKEQLDGSLHHNFYADWNDERTFFYFNTSDYTDWKLVLAIPATKLFQPISGIRTTVFVSGGLALLIALVFAQHFIRKIVKPIRMIESTMKKVEKGKWELASEPEGNDEISSLVKNYNKMVNRLSFLVDRVYKAELENQKAEIMSQRRELERRKVEFQALQSQINPHFLYNTLGTINSYAIFKEIDEVSEMTEALANMFRYSTKNLEIATMEDELSHVGDFLIIQQHRWQKKFPLDIDMEDHLLHSKIVKLSLQPLVENAIEHGFQTITDSSKVTIKGEVSGTTLFISVIDNGVGIEQVRLTQLREQLENEQLHYKIDQGIGLLNVSKRTKLLFGEEYGIEIFSEVNKGTTVMMSVPYTSKSIK
ncbi:signal protein [Oceanobacillus arenosus]|uniref:Signal protein n=1 Tax=Oceanobacillus arenosus TaxID=1229153 RepID=A0A3D8PLH1_9BACI|nr:histidine kinase [Oceanobacillus arenosus]RDW16015.1 signal protein [Oceanobacillus arenosus]